MKLCWAPAVALSCCLVMVRPACVHGQAPAPAERASPARTGVVVDSDQCDLVAHDELRELVALELAPRTVRSKGQAEESSGITRALVSCHDTRASLLVQDTVHGREQELTLDLTDVAMAARSRLLALTLSELIATVDMDATPRPPALAPQGETPAPKPSLPLRPQQSRLWLGLGIAREGRPRALAPSLQTGISAAVTQWPLALQGELQLHRGQRAVSSGDVVSYLVSGSAGLAGQLQTAWVDLSLGLGARLGYARLRGEPNDTSVTGQDVSGLWWGPTVGGSAVLPVRTRWGVRGGLDLTYVVREVRGLDSSGSASYTVEGFIVHANLGFTLALGRQRSARR